MENNGKKKKILLLLCVFTLIIVSFGITYAFFYYRKTGDVNTLRLGSIKFSSNYETVSLQNAFPINSNDINNDTRNVATITVSINGKTTYAEGVEYLVTMTAVKNIAGNTAVPISLVVSSVNGLGTSDNTYFTNRGSTDKIYKIMADDTIYNGEYVVIGYIPTSDVMTSGTITLKAYLDEDKVVVSDTYDGTESDYMKTENSWVDGRTVVSYSDWHELKTKGISFKIQIEAHEGTWVNEPGNFYNLIEGKATTAPTYVKSYTTSIINNGNPTFKTQDTVGENINKQEVYYYTGSDAITNGNVLYAGFCWQIVRTTDNGGIRLIYNGIAENNQCTDNRSSNTYLAVKGTYNAVSLASSYLYGDSYDYDLSTGKFRLVNKESSPRTWTISTYESFLGKYTCQNATGENCDNVWHVGGYYVFNNNYMTDTTKYSIGDIAIYNVMGSSSSNAGYTSVANVGYMYNKIYHANSGTTSGAIYGKDVEYANGNYLVIENTSGVASSNTTLDATHHYSCGTLDANDNPEITCETVRYYYSSYSGNDYYIELTGGETVEDALKNMINYKQPGDNIDANINVISSSIKDYLEIWYDKNLKAYEEYLDTNAVYCNDRTVASLGGWNKTNGGLTNYYLNFKQYNINKDLACENKTDRFSKGNSKARIRNPIGLITEPERGLMDGSYAAIGSEYLGLSPLLFGGSEAYNISVAANGSQKMHISLVNSGVRAVITLKPGTVILEGSGLTTDPYQVGPLVIRAN